MSEEKKSYDLTPDNAQQKFIDTIKKGYNCKSISVYGSGKTTMSLYCAKANPSKKFLLLLYNARLKLETQKRVKEMGLKNIKCLSIHSCATRYFKSCYNDFLLKEILDDDLDAKSNPCYDVLICDEVQDFIPMYLKFVVKKVMKELCIENVQLGIIGDDKQLLYEYNGANPKYLLNAEKYFPSKRKWVNCPLNISYRLTYENARFINECMLHENRVETVKGKHGPLPLYFVMSDPYDDINLIGEKIMDLLEIYEPEQIFIIAYSIKNPNSPVRKIENYLVRREIKCYVPLGDDSVLDSDLMKGKLCFMSCYQSKGLENDCIIIIGFDESLSVYFKQDTNTCPNILSVATSRPRKQLVLCVANDMLKFLKLNLNYVEHNGEIYNPKQTEEKEKAKEMKISTMTNHKTIDLLLEALKMVEYTTIQEPIEEHNLELKIETGEDLYEEVSELYGVCIFAYYEYKMTGKSSLGEADNSLNLKKIKHMMKHTLNYVTKRDKFLFKKAQITEFDWVDTEAIKSGFNNLKTYLPPADHLSFEMPFEQNINGIIYRGCTDIIDDISNTIWEIKCTKELKREHILQLAGYLALSDYSEGNLFNAITSEIIHIKIPKEPAKFLGLFAK